MRSKLGLALAFVLALALGTSGAFASNAGKIQNTNSSTTSSADNPGMMKTKRSKRRHRKPSRRRHRRGSKKTTANGNGNTHS